MPRYHNINGNKVQFTAAEETARDNEEAAWANAAPARALADLRAKRNRLLAETDFYALSDVTMSSDMTTYRQNLRDLPDGKDTVANIIRDNTGCDTKYIRFAFADRLKDTLATMFAFPNTEPATLVSRSVSRRPRSDLFRHI